MTAEQTTSMLWTLNGPDSDLHFFDKQDGRPRCTSCGGLTGKWDELGSPIHGTIRRGLDVSSSYDNVSVVSQRFRDVYYRERLTGLTLHPIEHYYAAACTGPVVRFASQERCTLFENWCETCQQWQSVARAHPAILVRGQHVGDRAFVQTDIWFGSGDEKGPLIICGPAAAHALKKEKLNGLELAQVLWSTHHTDDGS